jgi:addiction module HigA family antidote
MPRKNPPLPPVHPGEILREDQMKPLGLGINALARDLRAPVTRVREIVNGRRSISADPALRLARYFGNTPQFWINLQAANDLEASTRRSVGQIKRDVHPREAARHSAAQPGRDPCSQASACRAPAGATRRSPSAKFDKHP